MCSGTNVQENESLIAGQQQGGSPFTKPDALPGYSLLTTVMREQQPSSREEYGCNKLYEQHFYSLTSHGTAKDVIVFSGMRNYFVQSEHAWETKLVCIYSLMFA